MSGRCVACDSKLTEEEMCRKRHDTGEYLDMCTRCLKEVDEIVELPIDLPDYISGSCSADTEEDERCVCYDKGEI